MQYRTELDALNRIVKQNDQMIEMLDYLVKSDLLTNQTIRQEPSDKPKRPYTRRKAQ